MAHGQRKRRKARLYGLFERQPDGKWLRIYDSLAFRKPDAVRIFQGSLLSSCFGAPERRLKPVEVRRG